MVIESQSLFDYLGKKAGSELGQKVHAAAAAKDVWIGTKEIEKSLVPSGYVCTYPISFLDEYFNKKPSKPIHSTVLEDRIEELEKRVEYLEKKYLKDEKLEDDLPF